MKNDVKPSIIKMEKEELQQLVQEVKETVAKVGIRRKGGRSSIKVVDLWNIHRNVRSANSLLRRRAV